MIDERFLATRWQLIHMTHRGPSSAALDVASSVRGMLWPAIPTPLGSQLLAVQYQLEVSQWLSPDELLARRAARPAGRAAWAAGRARLCDLPVLSPAPG
jgi:hypothetical protein